jgi:hypothetical protein
MPYAYRRAPRAWCWLPEIDDGRVASVDRSSLRVLMQHACTSVVARSAGRAEFPMQRTHGYIWRAVAYVGRLTADRHRRRGVAR